MQSKYLMTRRKAIMVSVTVVSVPSLALAQQRRADVRVTDLTWSTDLGATFARSEIPFESDVLFRARVQNAGRAAWPVNVALRVDFSVDGQVVTWSDTHTSGLARQASVDLTANAGVEGSRFWVAEPAEATVQVGARVDPLNRILEKSETNNMTVMSAVIGAASSSLGADAVVFDAGFSPVPQDNTFAASDSWRNRGWPVAISGTAATRVNVQMYVAAPDGAGSEPVYHDNPVAANGANDANGDVQIRLAGGSFGISAVDTTKGIWTVNADGLTLSYKPKFGAAAAGGASVEDTEAEYRWSDDGGATWSRAGILKMTLVPPPATPVIFIDDHGGTPDSKTISNQTAWTNAFNAIPTGGTLTQRNPAHRWSAGGDPAVAPAPSTGTSKHLYALNIGALVPATGSKWIRCFSTQWSDANHPPLELLFIDSDGRSYEQLTDASTTVLWHYTFDLEHRHFFAFRGATVNPTFKARLRDKYSIHKWTCGECYSNDLGSDIRVHHSDFYGCFRGAITQVDTGTIGYADDCRMLVAPVDVRGKRGLTQVPRTEPIGSPGTMDVRFTRCLIDALVWSYKVDATTFTILFTDCFENTEFGGYNDFLTGTNLTGGRYMIGPIDTFQAHRSYPDSAGTFRYGLGTQNYTGVKFIVCAKGYYQMGAPPANVGGTLATPPSTHVLGANIAYESMTGVVHHFHDCDFHVDEGLIGHTGGVHAIRLWNGNGTANIVRTTSCRFHAAADGRQFTSCFVGIGGTFNIEYDSACDFGGMTAFGTNVSATLI